MIEYFQDFDLLRSGCITEDQFRRALSTMGLSALRRHNLSNSQFKMLADAYRNPQHPDKIFWTQFMADIESGKLSPTQDFINIFDLFDLKSQIHICCNERFSY